MHYPIPGIVGSFVLILSLAFVVWYWRPSLQIKKRLAKAAAGIGALKASSPSPAALKDEVSQVMAADETLKHLWAEYEETLHDQHEIIGGERRVAQIRATVPAEVFFNTQVLVDTPMRTEFFRHLPGILTGIGIIGTFFGLIVGLEGFHPTDNADAVRGSLNALMTGVKDAFYASASAIFAAMLITFFEKMSLTGRYKQVEELCQAIDALYEAGAGEEYLARLVNASEESATQTTQLKDSLVEDLKQMMTNLVERQIQANQENNRVLAGEISQSITTSLHQPLTQIAEVVQNAAGQQGTAVHGMLENLLSAFMAKLDETFGNQFAGLSNMMTESVRAMQDMQNSFKGLVADLENAGRSSSDAMAERIAQMMGDAAERQRLMQEQMASFVVELRKALNETQSETHGQLTQTLEVMKEQMLTMMNDFQAQRKTALDEEQQRQTHLHTQTGQLIGNLGSEIGQLVAQTSESVAAMQRNINALQELVTSSISRMNNGAETMYLAASEFTQAGEKISRAMNQGDETLGRLTEASRSLGQAAQVMQTVTAEYAQARNSITSMTASLQALIENAKREAGVSRQIVEDMQKVSQRLGEVQHQTNEYLQQVSSVLATSFNSFGDSVERNMDKSRAAFDKSLTEAVGMIGESVQELDELLVKLADMLGKVVR